MSRHAAGTAPRSRPARAATATFAALEPGRYTIQVESPGFEPADVRDLRVRAGDNRREVKLAIARFAETVQVGRDPRERASDPRSDAFATVLGQAQIDELPDDPDEMEQVLREMAGPGAVMRVNGFRGGRLPPKGQIQQIRFRRNMFAADTHEPGFVSVDIITKPGIDNWRGSTSLGFRDAALNARNAFAPVKGDEQHERYGFSAERTAVEAAHVAGAVGRRHRRVRHARRSSRRCRRATSPIRSASRTTRSNVDRALRAQADAVADAARRGPAQSHRRATTSASATSICSSAATARRAPRTCCARSNAGAIGKTMYNELRLQWRADEVAFTPASAAPAVLVLNAFNAGGAQVAGSRSSTPCSIADDLDIAIGRHAIRAGVQLDAGRYRTDELPQHRRHVHLRRASTPTPRDGRRPSRATSAIPSVDDRAGAARRSTCRTTSARARI